MKVHYSRWALFFITIPSLWMTSCNQDPDFPVIPKIDFESINFKRGLSGSENTPDTLIIRVKFQDGDGDLGLGGEEKDPPFQQYDYLPKPNGEPCLFSDRFNAEDCPGLPTEFNCIDYQSPFRFGEELINDTAYVEINENDNNFTVELMTKVNGAFEVYDFRKNCQPTLSGRFPRVKENFTTEGPLEGVIEYKPTSYGFLTLFRNDTIKLRMRIKDRALHDSNPIESCEFTLNELLETDGCPERP